MIGPRFGRRTVGAIVASCLALAGCAAEPTVVRTQQHQAKPVPAQAKPAQAKPAQAKPAQAKPAQAKPAQAKPAPALLTASRHPVIVIDPGHSGRSIRHRNKATGLIDFDYPNTPEMYEVFQISTCVAKDLRSIGYRVIVTKKSATSTVSLSRRARIADNAHADLAISIHDDHSQTARFQAVYSQRGVKHNGAYHAMWRGSGADRTVFRHPTVARKSARATQLIARARSAVQHRHVTITEENFSGRAGLEPGNLALVQLLSHVPWVYSEAGAQRDGSTTTPLTVKARTRYAKGILDGIVAAVPVQGAKPESKAAMRQCILRHRSG